MGPNTESGVMLMLEIMLAALLLIPLAGFVMPLVWGWQAHLELKKREAGDTKFSS